MKDIAVVARNEMMHYAIHHETSSGIKKFWPKYTDNRITRVLMLRLSSHEGDFFYKKTEDSIFLELTQA